MLKRPSTTGWWFGTFFIFPYIGNNHPNWLIFFRGVQTTNQLLTKLSIFVGLNFCLIPREGLDDAKTLWACLKTGGCARIPMVSKQHFPHWAMARNWGSQPFWDNLICIFGKLNEVFSISKLHWRAPFQWASQIEFFLASGCNVPLAMNFN